MKFTERKVIETDARTGIADIWRVEFAENHVGTFSGPDGERRAKRYAAWLDEHPETYAYDKEAL